MITGANTNVRYRGVLYHVQTEDSGRANPHVISHVYHGGTILGSQKTDYSDRLDSDDLVSVVRGLIDEQHAAMLEKLDSGGFDRSIQERLGEQALDGSGSRPSKPDTEPEAGGPDEDTEPAVVRPAPTLVPAPVRGFGEGIGSPQPLDEVILEYLAKKARDRAPGASPTAARKPRTGG